MKNFILNLIFGLLLTTSTAWSAEENKHAHKPTPGPKGGKILETEPLHAEFFVQPDKKVNITFYSADMKSVAPTVQEVKVIAEPKSGKVTLDFEKKTEGFVSKTLLPEGEGYRIVVQIKNNATTKPQNFRIDYHTEICGECKLAEYACFCETAGGGSHAH